MRKVIAGINMTLDGYCDHTAVIPDDDVHEHYSELLRNAGIILHGRITYQLMQYWQDVIKNPTGNKAMDEFAVVVMDRIPKLVFSRTLKETGWETARLAKKDLKEEILQLKRVPGKDILIGSPSLIVAALNLQLVDELQLCIHPVVAGSGLPLFKNIEGKPVFKLLKTKSLGGGAVIHYYEPVEK